MQSIKNLKNLQIAFKRHLLNGDNSIIEHIVSMENADNQQRMNTYTNAYYGRLLETLVGDYPAVQMILGSEAFASLCHEYIQVHPSTHYSLRWFGQHLPVYLGEATATRDQVFLSEMANLEWAFITAFDAANMEILEENIVTTIAPEAWPEIRIDFHPSVQLVDYDWNIVDLWRAVSEEEDLPTTVRLAEKSTCLIWRQELTTRYRILEIDEAAALKAAIKGASFAELCEIVSCTYISGESEDEQVNVAMRSAGLLKTWLAESLIVKLH